MFNFQKTFLIFLFLLISTPIYSMQNWSNSLYNLFALISNVFVPVTKKVIIMPFWNVYTKLNKYTYTRNQHLDNISPHLDNLKSSFHTTLEKELQKYIKNKEQKYIQNSFLNVVMKELQEENSSQENLDKVERYLEQGTNPDCTIQFKEKQFCENTNRSSLQVAKIRCLYNRSKNTTPLVVAIEKSKLKLVKILLKYRANVNAYNDDPIDKEATWHNNFPHFWTKPLLFPLLIFQKNRVRYNRHEEYCLYKMQQRDPNYFPIYMHHRKIAEKKKKKEDQETNLKTIETLLDNGACLENLDSCNNNIFHIFSKLAIKSKIIEKFLIHANFNSKEESQQHKIITILCIFDTFKFSNKDIHFRIFSYLPEYFNHCGLYGNLFAQNYVHQPYSLFQISMRLERFTNMLQQRNKWGKIPLDGWSQLYPPEELEKYRPYFSEKKFQKDFDAFKKAYNTILSNSAFDKTTKSESELDLLLLPSLQLEFDIQNNNIAYKMFKYSVLKKHPSLLASNTNKIPVKTNFTPART